MTCAVLETGTIELYWYGELSYAARLDTQVHLERCPVCRRALEDLETIRAALAGRRDISSPDDGDWSGFMSRLNAAVEGECPPAPLEASRGMVMPAGRRLVGYLAVAALLALVTVSVFMVVRDRGAGLPPAPQATGASAADDSPETRSAPDPALVSLSDQHFQRSKLVLLGLTTRDAAGPDTGSWAYERDLASSLLNDTRLYRLAVEERGMSNLADVMRDLEMVLLQTSMSEGQDRTSLEGIQRLIRRRDLLTRMTVVHAGGY